LLAAEALAVSAQMSEVNCKRTMVGLAACYERLADHAAKHEAASTRSR
jgi:hypothetical protein